MTVGEFFTGLGYLVGLAVFVWASRRRGLSVAVMRPVIVGALVGAIVGAKIAQLVAQGWPLQIPWWLIYDPRYGGRALLGGVVGGWIGVEIGKRRLGIKRSTGDLFALALPAGEAVGRIGCFFNGCCYGTECHLPWAVWQHNAWRHPSQLYSALVAAVIFAFVLRLELKFHVVRGPGEASPIRGGDLFWIYLLLFGVSRFGLEFVRWRESLILGLSPMQWFCLDLIAVGGVGLIRSKTRVQRAPA
ncbi:MAG TPA: prolipoprotein diacylglyceryl transferase family protein [Fimbriimonas sp.]|nr:prolipoprotein diacylglyceryl transferase family protein [Fimbriimonas sp.]